MRGPHGFRGQAAERREEATAERRKETAAECREEATAEFNFRQILPLNRDREIRGSSRTSETIPFHVN